MSQGPKVNRNYLYPHVADQPSSSSNPSMTNRLPAPPDTVNAPGSRPTYSTYASPSTSASYAAAEYVIPETTRSSPVQRTRHRKSGSSSRLYQDSCSSDTCSQPSLPPTPPPFNARPTREWLTQLPDDIPVRSTAQDTKRDSPSSRYQEVSGTSDRSTSGLSSPAPISVGGSPSRIKGRPRVNGLYVGDYDPKRRSLISRAARIKETAEKQAAARLSVGRQTAESPTADSRQGESRKTIGRNTDSGEPNSRQGESRNKDPRGMEEWQNDEENGGWI
ncbi:hypothetical protein BELL_0080g00110 [Botrytis elliptica]|uniref:Uncharacterized protein n=1 Tax=Botrytis elliptica TaxID=278938 RepID=A0A4Z1K3L3_9HELO|nr:hypothetical protein BELL_0080g00110 [Botrytis elliptica]